MFIRKLIIQLQSKLLIHLKTKSNKQFDFFSFLTVFSVAQVYNFYLIFCQNAPQDRSRSRSSFQMVNSCFHCDDSGNSCYWFYSRKEGDIQCFDRLARAPVGAIVRELFFADVLTSRWMSYALFIVSVWMSVRGRLCTRLHLGVSGNDAGGVADTSLVEMAGLAGIPLLIVSPPLLR